RSSNARRLLRTRDRRPARRIPRGLQRRGRIMSCSPPTAACIDRRQHLRLTGYLPIPLYGKAPVLKEWQKLTVISRDMIELWAKVWPDAHNTGALTDRKSVV